MQQVSSAIEPYIDRSYYNEALQSLRAENSKGQLIGRRNPYFFAGILREYFEKYETNPLMQKFWKTCPICSMNSRIKLCGRSGSKDRASLNGSSNIRYLRPLFRVQNNFELLEHLYLDPPDLFGNLFYFYCPKV